jgi:triphosphoribosyl-dephospho-CoA synthetase
MFKADMVARAKADTNIKRWNADEADAYHIARFSARFHLFLNGEIDEDVLLPSEKHVFLREKVITKGVRAGETEGLGTVYRENERFFRFSKLEAP